MRRQWPTPAPFVRRAAQVALAGAGLAALFGSGGGGGWDFTCCGNWQWPPEVSVSPERYTLQVGQSVTFTALVLTFGGTVPQTVSWCRRAAGANDCVPIPGATARTYTLANANLADDGATIQASATNENGTGQDAARVAVTAAAGVTYADAEFAPGNWQVSATIDPVGAPLTWSVAQQASGGSPDAYLRVNYSVPPPGGRVRLWHLATSGVYDPAVRGAAYVIDFELDCSRIAWEGFPQSPRATPAVVQAGRRFVVSERTAPAVGCADTWGAVANVRSVVPAELVQVEGPACPAGATCPDFSAQGAPIQLGFQSEYEVVGSAVTASVVQGIDNWRITVWPR